VDIGNENWTQSLRSHRCCGFSSFMSRRDGLTSGNDGILTRCPPHEISLLCPLPQGREITSRRAQFALTIPYAGFRHVTIRAVDARRYRLKLFHCNGFRPFSWKTAITHGSRVQPQRRPAGVALVCVGCGHSWITKRRGSEPQRYPAAGRSRVARSCPTIPRA
jgi:hypothetical protein